MGRMRNQISEDGGQVMSSRVSRDDVEQMQRLYSDGMSVNKISAETGWAPRTVQNHLWPITETEIFVKEPV